ncbi:hypothetical protein HPCPY1313_1036 [Helicobacter pylori CPY1313]|nr:hypothetical protein HPCPY1313_1036 [Helicobacter pylori CPY1313]
MYPNSHSFKGRDTFLSLSVGIETDKKGNNSTMKPKGRISVNMLI